MHGSQFASVIAELLMIEFILVGPKVKLLLYWSVFFFDKLLLLSFGCSFPFLLLINEI